MKCPKFRCQSISIKMYTIVLLISMTCNQIHISEARKIANDQELRKIWKVFVETLSPKCQTFSNEVTKGIFLQQTLESACSGLQSEAGRKSTEEFCTADDYDSVVSFMCSDEKGLVSHNLASPISMKSTTINITMIMAVSFLFVRYILFI